jgi:cysteinyl-tRNA synthetase
MAKSAGEFLRVQALVDRGYDPLAFRYLCLTGHYRTQLNFTWDALDAAATGIARMRAGFHALAPTAGAAVDAEALAAFTAHINDDLNTPRALALAWEVLRGDLPDQVKRATLGCFDEVFGLGLTTWQPPREEAPPAVEMLARARAAARAAKNWSEADRLRAELHAAGWEMEDRADGYALKRR